LSRGLGQRQVLELADEFACYLIEFQYLKETKNEIVIT